MVHSSSETILSTSLVLFISIYSGSSEQCCVFFMSFETLYSLFSLKTYSNHFAQDLLCTILLLHFTFFSSFSGASKALFKFEDWLPQLVVFYL